nr:hypothetical protein [Chryseobacterium defluvii]
MKIENYVWRAETQENGNIHFHLLFDTYFNHNTLKRVWNHYLKDMGYMGGERAASIHAIKNLNDVGAYVTKYMTKEPLKDKYKKMLENRQITQKELDKVPNDEKYRRPIIGKMWGCSKKLLKLSYLTCYDYEIAQMNEIVDQMREVVVENLPEYVKVFTGNVRSILKKCSYKLQKWVRGYYELTYDRLYNFIEEVQESVQEVIPKKKQLYQQLTLFEYGSYNVVQ